MSVYRPAAELFSMTIAGNQGANLVPTSDIVDGKVLRAIWLRNPARAVGVAIYRARLFARQPLCQNGSMRA